MKKLLFLVSLLGVVHHASAMVSKVTVNDLDLDLDLQLIRAVRNEEGIARVELLLEQGADINVQDKYGKAPLHRAVEFKDVACGKLLLENGADINIKDNDGKVALFCAVLNYDVAFIELLLENGADPNIKDKKGETSLYWAVRHKDAKLFRSVLSYSVFFTGISDDSIKLFLTVRCMFNRFKVSYKLPKDVHYLILGKLPIEFLVPLLHCKNYPHSLKVSLSSKLAEYSMEQLDPIMVEVRKKIPPVFGPLSDELENLLNPKLLEENIGEELLKNCRKFLERKGEK